MQCTSTSQAGRWPLGRLLARADLLQRDKRTDGPARAVRTADREGRGTRNLLNRCFKVFIMFVFRSAGQGVASKPAPLHPKRCCLRSAGGAKSVSVHLFCSDINPLSVVTPSSTKQRLGGVDLR